MEVNNLTVRTKKRSVKALLVDRGVKQVDIAHGCAVSPALVSGVVSGKKKSRRVRRAIARALGMKVSDLWQTSGGREAA